MRTLQARSSVVEHYLDMVVVGGSIPLAPTSFFQGHCGKAQCLFVFLFTLLKELCQL